MNLRKSILLILVPLLCIVSCKKKDKGEEIASHNPVEGVAISNISETGCSINWEVYPEDITKVSIDLSENESFSPLVGNFVLNDVNQTSYKLEKLKELTTYYVRILALKKDGSVYTTTALSFQTSSITNKLFITTVDGNKIETTIMVGSKNSFLKI